MSSRHQTAEEVEAEHIRVLGPELGALYHALWNEIGWLHAKWKVFRQLYGESSARIDLLNRVASHAFRVLQDVQWEDTILHLARLTDPPQSPGKGTRANLSVLRLAALVGESSLAVEVERLAEGARSACEFARDWRNRRLAHRDLALALDQGAQPLAGVSRADVERALTALRELMNHLDRHFWQSETMYQEFLAVGDADQLVYYLDTAVKAEDAQRARWAKGEFRPDDLE